jgi:hypothetical protein
MKHLRKLFDLIYTAGALLFCGFVLWVVVFQMVWELRKK